jgi:hypothetical protein
MPNEGYLDTSVHWKVQSGKIGFAEPTHDEVAEAILEVGLATEVGQRLGSGRRPMCTSATTTVARWS